MGGVNYGEYLGEIEPLGYGLWRWPFKQMKEGDYFTVSEAQKPVGAVRQYAYSEGSRLRKRFLVTTDGETITVTREPRLEDGGRLPSEVAADKAILVGGDGDKYLGVLVPPDGARWSWPFGRMEPGQYFHVRHSDRHPERVRQTAMVRAACLAIQLSVCANDPVNPGHARIEYVDVRAKAAATDFTYDMTNELLLRCYDTDLDKIDPWGLQPSERGHVPAGRKKRFVKEQIAAPKVASFIARIPEYTFGVQLDKEGITFTGLELGTTYREWMMQEALS